ncbi:MAG: hypothetical protein V8R07_04940 [Bacteroides fragilis]
MSEDKLYFAYGSDINLDQMAYRCPAAQMVGPSCWKTMNFCSRQRKREWRCHHQAQRRAAGLWPALADHAGL